MNNIHVERDNEATVITLSRPERLNSLSHELIDVLLDALEEIENDDNCRVVVIQGEGRAFCAGDDLKGMGEIPDGRWKDRKPVRRFNVLPQQKLASVELYERAQLLEHHLVPRGREGASASSA